MEEQMARTGIFVLALAVHLCVAGCSGEGREPVVDSLPEQELTGGAGPDASADAMPDSSAADPGRSDAGSADTGVEDALAQEIPHAEVYVEVILPDAPVEMPGGCCLNDDHCLLGGEIVWVCSWNDQSGQWGRCMSLLDDVSCWDSGDCAEGESCQGAFYCPCEAPCGAPDIPGECVDEDELGDVGAPCGPDGGPCKEGLACCYPCGIMGCEYECTLPCDDNEPGCEDGCYLYA